MEAVHPAAAVQAAARAGFPMVRRMPDTLRGPGEQDAGAVPGQAGPAGFDALRPVYGGPPVRRAAARRHRQGRLAGVRSRPAGQQQEGDSHGAALLQEGHDH